MGSLSTVDSCVGRSYDLIIFDEAALGADAQEAFNISLRPTLDKPNSKAIFISTPRGKNNWFSVFFQRGFSPEFPEWYSITADYTENIRMKESDVQEAKRSMSRAEFEQEYMASFTTFEGQIYASFDSTKHVKYFEVSDSLEYIAGLDPGYKDPTAFIVIVYDPKLNIFHVIDEYQEAQATTDIHAQKFNSFVFKYGIESIFIDSASAQFASDLAYSYDLATTKAKKQVNEGIAYVQTLIENDRLLVSPNCTYTLSMLDQYRWKMDAVSGIERPNHDIHSHMADALRYALYSFTV
jgi:phage terminase large subunit